MNTVRKREEEIRVVYVDVTNIRPNPYQPRKVFDKRALYELVESIKEYGVLQPIHVRESAHGTYELIAGERRWRASKIAGLRKIPALVIEASEKESALIAILENLQREDLNYIEEAIGFQNIIRDYHMTQEELARKLGKSQSTIANKLRLLKLPEDVKQILLEENLSERHARAMLKIKDDELQRQLISEVAKNNLTVQKTEDLIDRKLERQEYKQKSIKSQKLKRNIKDIRLFANTIKKAVSIMESAGVEIDYIQRESDMEYIFQVRVKK